MPTIPKTLHAIWLGGVLREAGRENLENWRKTNPNYEMCLWIDSSLYRRGEGKEAKLEEPYLTQLKELLEWADNNKIVICDLALEPGKTYGLDSNENEGKIQEVVEGQSKYGVITGRSDIYENMPHHQYYDDEITGKYANFAAASDVLRVEILYQQGGIYFDVEDVLPGKQLLTDEDLSAEYGFLQFSSGNNDSIASVREGTIIDEYRKTIVERYKELYANEMLLRAHRDPNFSTHDNHPFLMASGGGAYPRTSTTIKVSGPDAMQDAVTSLASKRIPEAGKNLPGDYGDRGSALEFGDYFKRTPRQANAWFLKTTKETVMAKLRALAREYFAQQIDGEIKKIEANKVRWRKVTSTADEKSMLLQVLKIRLNAFLPETSMEAVYNSCIADDLGEKLKASNGSNILDRLERFGRSLETLIKAWGEAIDNKLLTVEDLFEYSVKRLVIPLNKLFARPGDKDALTQFTENVLDTPDGKPNLAALHPSLNVLSKVNQQSTLPRSAKPQ